VDSRSSDRGDGAGAGSSQGRALPRLPVGNKATFESLEALLPVSIASSGVSNDHPGDYRRISGRIRPEV